MPSKRSRKAPQRAGRPTHLTPQIAKRVCAAVRKGLPLKVAAGLARVPYRTVKEWLQKGQRDGAEEHYRSFADEIEFARATAAEKFLERMTSPKGNSKKQRVLAHVAERLYPSLFDQTGDVEVVVECEAPPEATGETPVAPDVAAGGDPHAQLSATSFSSPVGGSARRPRGRVAPDAR
jgi:hypothetical protein